MRNPLRIVLASIALLLLGGGLIVASSPRIRQIGRDFLVNYENALPDCPSEAAIAAQCNESRCVRQRLALKMLITKDLVDGRITLDVATAQFVELNRDIPEAIRRTRKHFAGDTDDESTALQVMSFVRSQLQHNPSVCAEKLHDLERQLEPMRGRGPMLMH